MDEIKDLVPKRASEIKTDFFDPIVWAQMSGMAQKFIDSKSLPASENAGTLIMKMQAGREMGMGPIESLKSFYFVNGTINIFGSAVTRRLRDHGWDITYSEQVDSCTATITRGQESYSDTLTFADAEKSGWTVSSKGPKPGWFAGANRKLKLRYGALSMLIKTHVPEVMGSAVDIAEIAQDTAPLFEKKSILPELTPESPRWAEAVQYYATHANLEAIKQKMSITEGNEQLLIEQSK